MAKPVKKTKTPGRRQNGRAKDATHDFVRGARLMTARVEIPTAEFTEVSDLHKRLFLAAIANSCNYGMAARAAGVSHVTAWKWRKDASDEAFQRAFETAVKLGIERAEDELHRRGVDGVEAPIYQGGRLVGTRQEYDTTAAIFWLKGALPEKYRERFEHAGPRGGPMQMEIAAPLTLEQLRSKVERVSQVTRLWLESQGPIIDVAPVAEAQQGPDLADAYAQTLAQRNGGRGNGRG